MNYFLSRTGVIMIFFEFIELTLNYETKFGEANYEL